jgi:2-polyprenyl-3-methyl-5-hydroxy-6-metoxy-1,4-benzoquinol methylase
MQQEKDIIQSWQANATHWIQLIENNGIESRKLVTNQAIIDAVARHKPVTVFDLGCGEGWLAGEFAARGMQVTGMDAIPELIDRARSRVDGDFHVGSYEDLAAGRLLGEQRFDIIVINFALIGKESTELILSAVPRFLHENGHLIIQTLHPHARKEIGDYNSGWKSGSWDGLGDQFTLPYEWYFRTLEDWLALLSQSGLGRVELHETRHPVSGRLLSVIFECSVK